MTDGTWNTLVLFDFPNRSMSNFVPVAAIANPSKIHPSRSDSTVLQSSSLPKSHNQRVLVSLGTSTDASLPMLNYGQSRCPV